MFSSVSCSLYPWCADLPGHRVTVPNPTASSALGCHVAKVHNRAGRWKVLLGSEFSLTYDVLDQIF